LILGIVGSPRKGQLTDQLVSAALDGAGATGAMTKKIYLVDFEVPFYTEEAEAPSALSEMCDTADALIIGAPVYYGDINGLTKDFMDTVQMTTANGKYGLGIAVAGGTGKGFCLGVQTIYSFFFCRRMRGVEPTPVSRFNFEKALLQLHDTGKRLAEISKMKKPFQNLWDRIEYYEGLDYLKYTFLDEILFLASQLLDISKSKPEYEEAKQQYEIARSLTLKGKRIEAAKHASKAYNTLYF